MEVQGVWLPVITPFRKGEIDYESYGKLVEFYISQGISGIIPLGTTGESPVVSDEEFQQVVEKTVEIVHGRIPVYAGVGGNHTERIVKKLKEVKQTGVDGILTVCPYYNRPGQDGLYHHFKKISDSTDLNILMYNIPYRTGVNMSNDTIRRLAKLHNIVGLKDSCGDIGQSLELLSDKPDNFSVLTGEDILFYTHVVNGGDGGILASSHLFTDVFISVYTLLCQNDFKAAFKKWRNVNEMIRLLFREPNPGPLKYCLEHLGKIHSHEMRLPMTGISEQLKQTLKEYLNL